MINRTGFKRKLEYLGVKILLFLFQSLTRESALKFAEDLGWISFNILRLRRKYILKQLNRVFGEEKSEKEIKEIALGVYQNFGKTLFEFSRLPITSREKLLELVEFHNIRYLDEALEKGNGAIVVTAHFGSWEMLAAATAANGYPVNSIVGRQHNQYVDDLINQIRDNAGNKTIPIKTALRGLITALRRNEIVAILSDQDAGKSSVFVEFMGLPAKTPAGPALFRIKFGAPLIPVFIVRRDDGIHHDVYFEPPIEYESTGNRKEDITQITQKYTNLIEEYVRKYPDHWFWLHRRWKRQPKQNQQKSI